MNGQEFRTRTGRLAAVLIPTLLLALAVPAAGQAASSTRRVTVEVTARNFRFSVSEITVPAGAQVTVRFTNRDEGIPHNISFYRSESAGEVFYKGQVIQGNGRIEYSFTAPERPGRYFFRCDIHPVQMNGVFVVE
jgi:plastocyanin